MSEHIILNKQDGVLEILFNRPDKKNALTNDMYRTAREALEQAQEDPTVRVVLIGAEGDAFTAGNDLSVFAEVSSGTGGELQAGPFIKALGAAKKPIVAAVPGIAVGVGLTMLLHCDLVYVADSAKLLAPFVNLALVPEAASSMLLPARIGYARAFAMFALGESLSGTEAATLGLANKVLPAGEVIAAARQAAADLASKPAGALAATKQLMRGADSILECIDVELEVFQDRLKSDEAREAFAAFAERRAPDFSKFSA